MITSRIHASRPSKHTATAARPRRADLGLLAIVVFLLVFGLQAMYSASFALALSEEKDPNYYIVRQLMWAVVGAVCLAVCWRIPYWRWRVLSLPIFGAVIVALALVMVPGFGVNVNGSQRWLNIGGVIQLQPSEFAKLAAVIYFSAWLADRRRRLQTFGQGLIPFLLILGIMLALILRQPDLGTTTVTAVIAFTLFFLAGAPLQQIAALGGMVAVAAVPLILEGGYRQSRWQAFIDPWKDPTNNGFHIIQALIALGSGGLTGVGLGSSRQKFSYVFGSHNDAIFAIIGEELGLVGSLAVILAFVFLAYRGYRIAARCPDRFGALLAAGITTWFAAQAFINIGGITRSLPFTGIPLPFISHGGSALAVSMAAAGILLNVSRFAKSPEAAESEAEPAPRRQEQMHARTAQPARA